MEWVFHDTKKKREKKKISKQIFVILVNLRTQSCKEPIFINSLPERHKDLQIPLISYHFFGFLIFNSHNPILWFLILSLFSASCMMTRTFPKGHHQQASSHHLCPHKQVHIQSLCSPPSQSTDQWRA